MVLANRDHLSAIHLMVISFPCTDTPFLHQDLNLGPGNFHYIIGDLFPCKTGTLDSAEYLQCIIFKIIATLNIRICFQATFYGLIKQQQQNNGKARKQISKIFPMEIAFIPSCLLMLSM